MVGVWLAAQLGLLFIETFLFLALSGRYILLLSGHSLVALIYALAFGRTMASHYPQRGAALLGLILALFLPIAGICCAFLIALLLLHKPHSAGDLLGELEEYITQQNRLNPKKNLTNAGTELHQVSQNVEPLVDILSTQDLRLKGSILGAIAKSKNPKLYPHILTALEDPRPEIYQVAIAEATKLQDKYSLAIKRAMKAAQEAPNNLEAQHQLAEAFSAYLISGLVSQAVINFYYDQLRKQYKKIITLTPNDGLTFNKLGQLYLKTGQWHSAEGAFKKALTIRPNDLEAQLGLIELSYEQGGYREMLERIRRVRDELTPWDETTPIPLTWAEWWLTRERGTKEVPK